MKKIIIAYLSKGKGKKTLGVADFLKKYDGRVMSDDEWKSFYNRLYDKCNNLNAIYNNGSPPYIVEHTALGNIAVIAYLRGSRKTVALVKRSERETQVAKPTRKCYHIMAREMQKDCVDALHRVLRERKCGTLEAFQIACCSEAPRFYFTFELARRHVSRVERGLPLEIQGNINKVEALHEIHRRWKTLGTNSYASLRDILQQPAPSFYITYNHFMKAVYTKLRKDEIYK